MNRILAPILTTVVVSAPALIDSAAKGTALLIIIGFLVLCMRKNSAATRHLAWLLGIVGLLLLPFFSATLPAWRVLPAWASTPRVENGPIEKPRAEQVLPIEASLVSSTASPRISESFPAIKPSALPVLTDPPPSAPTVPTSRFGAGEWLGALWLAGATFLLLRIAAGAFLLRRSLRTAALVTDGPLRDALDDASRDLRMRQHILLLVDRRRIIPLVWGILRPRLVLPAEASSWDESRLRAVLLHELAHVKRGDLLVMLLTHVACALHWFNPLVWLAAWRMHIERERACDDLVLTTGIRASDYAEHLLHVATKLDTASPAGALAMARPSRLEGRLLAVLNQKLQRGGVPRPITALALALSFGIVIPIAMLRAQEDEPKSGPPAEIEAAEAVPNDILDSAPKTDEVPARTEAQPSEAQAVPREEQKIPVLEEVPVLNKLFQPRVGNAAVTLKEDGSLRLNDTAVSREELGEKLRALAKADAKGGIVIRAEQKVPYKEVVQLLDACRAAGLQNLAFEVAPERTQSIKIKVPSQGMQKQMMEAKAEEARLIAGGLGEEHPRVKSVRAQIAHYEKAVAPEQASDQSALELARLKQAELELQRATKLANEKLISQAELENAKAELEMRKAELSGDAAAVASIRLRRAENALRRAEELYKMKSFSAAELERARFEVELRKAELAGDQRAVARIKVQDAEARLKRIEELRSQNLVSEPELEVHRVELDAARALLQQRSGAAAQNQSTSGVSAEILQLLDDDLRLAEKKLAILKQEQSHGVASELPVLRMEVELAGLRRAKAAHEGKQAEVAQRFEEQIKLLEKLHEAASRRENDQDRSKNMIDIQREILALKREKAGAPLRSGGQSRQADPALPGARVK